jgi:AcrR family transcriptional regulator
MPERLPETRLRPRKIPRQPRSVETRARILDAARVVFAEHGYAAGTTNRIAEAAGLSVGSLYQYFPNKDAILVELVREHIADGSARIVAALAIADDDSADDDPAAAIERDVRAVITTLVEIHAEARRLHQVLFEESPRPPTLLAELHELEDAAVAAVAVRLERAGLALPDIDLAARITVAAIESLVHRLVASDRPLDADRFVDETTRLVAGYLAGPAALPSWARR